MIARRTEIAGITAIRPKNAPAGTDQQAALAKLRASLLTLFGTITPDAVHKTAVSSTGGMFTTIPARDDLSSQLIGLDLYNNPMQEHRHHYGVKAYIVAVGGFLGIGEYCVAVRPSAVTLSYNATEKKWHAAMDTNADQLSQQFVTAHTAAQRRERPWPLAVVYHLHPSSIGELARALTEPLPTA